MSLEYVACLTTIPPRIEYIHFTLNSLLNQSRPFDRVFLCIPHTSVRFQCPYVIPESLQVRKDIQIVRCKDFGPATKILGLLDAGLPEIGSGTRIFFCDDDRIYPSDRAKIFYDESVRYPEHVICQATTPYWKFFVDGNPRYDFNSKQLFPAGKHLIQSGYVDVFEGFGGVLVQPRFFARDVFEIPKEHIVVDDIWLSGHVTKNKRLIWGVNSSTPPTHEGDAKDPLYLLTGSNERKSSNGRCIDFYQKRHKIWESVESVAMDQRLVKPMLRDIHRLSRAIESIQGVLNCSNSLDVSQIQYPDEYIVELKTAPELEQALTTAVSGLIPDCEHVMQLLQSQKTAAQYLTEHKLVSKESVDKLLTPIQTFVSERTLRQRVDAFLSQYKVYRDTVLKTALFRSRLLCHGCSTRIYHFVCIPCGHLVCESCKHPMCPACVKVVNSFQQVAILN